jgi:hypothetical protein
MQISARLQGRDVVMDRVVFGAEAAEWVGIGAGIVAGGGVLWNAARAGGKWAVVKAIAVAGAAIAAEQGVEQALRAAGANETVVRGARLAATVISFVILRRRSGSPPPERSSTPAPKTRSAPGASHPPRSPGKALADPTPQKPPFPPPVAEVRAMPRRSTGTPHPSHLAAAKTEEQAARAIHELPDEVVIHWGEKIGAHGPDVVSYNLRTKTVTLWDVKWRGSPTRVQSSTTFKKGSDPLANALGQARRAIGGSGLSTADKEAAVASIKRGTFQTRTLGMGQAKNSTVGDHR